LSTIDEFVRRCEALGDRPWVMPAARLFLCTRPPSYFDVARRWLYRVEKEGFAPDVFIRLLEVVNAVTSRTGRKIWGGGGSTETFIY
jgi:hypothetical protein